MAIQLSFDAKTSITNINEYWRTLNIRLDKVGSGMLIGNGASDV